MRSETTWYAFDETEFDSREECEEYERTALDLINSVMFFDNEMNYLKDPTTSDIEGRAYYMVIKDAKKAQKLFKGLLATYISFKVPSSRYENGDKFEYKADGKWHNIDEEHRRIVDKINRFNSALKKILNETLFDVTN